MYLESVLSVHSLSTLTAMLYLFRTLVLRAIMAPGRKGRQQLSPLSWATLQPRMQGIKVAQRPRSRETFCHITVQSKPFGGNYMYVSRNPSKYVQMPQSSQQSQTFVFQSDGLEDTLYCVSVAGWELITFAWNAMATSKRNGTWKRGIIVKHEKSNFTKYNLGVFSLFCSKELSRDTSSSTTRTVSSNLA